MNVSTAPTTSLDRFKRVTLLTIIVLALLSTLIGWGVLDAQGLLTPALGWVQRIAALGLAVLLVAAWKNLLPQRMIEFGCLVFAALVYAACMVLRMYWPRYGNGIRLETLYLWVPVVYVFAFTMTDHRKGLFTSIAILLLFVVISVPYVARGGDAGYVNLTFQLYFVSAVLIAALYFFSGYQYRLGLAQVKVDQLAYLSHVDDLTGISNRRHMASIIVAELARCEDRKCGFAVMLFDIDHFKAVNDQLGHMAGDKALAALATRAAGVFRSNDSLGRWGGDEFVAVVRDVDTSQAETIAESLRRSVEGAPLFDACRVTISCGVTLAAVGEEIDNLLQRADIALYAAKRAGRNRVEGTARQPA